MTPVLTSLVLAYMFYPVYLWLNKKLKNKNASALIVSLLIIILIIIPLGFILFQLSKEVNVGYILLKQKVSTAGLQRSTTGIIRTLQEITQNPQIEFYIKDSLEKVASRVAQGALDFIFSIPTRLLEILLTFFFTFFLLRDGKELVTKVEKSLPLEAKLKKDIIKNTNNVLHGIIHGFFVIAIVEGVLGALTFWLFGVSSPIIWGLVIAFLTFIPFIGAIFVWVPAVIINLASSNFAAAIGITAGGLLISYIDTFLKPKVIGNKTAIHPAIVLLGLLGGLSLIGVAGIIIGPIILSLLILFIGILTKRK